MTLPCLAHATPHGVVVVDKPRGLSSHDVVAQARRWYHTRRVGHAGTLDPMATGVLLLLLGEATKLSALLTGHTKTYQATVSLASSTDSLDADGRVTATASPDSEALGEEAVRAALQGERERREQIPPAVSAIKVAGKRAYALARKGQPPELAPRPVEVRRLDLLALCEQTLQVELEVTKGYYVRAFARDLGQRLGRPAHLSQLRRLASGPFCLSEAQPWPLTERKWLELEGVLGRVVPAATLTPEGTTKATQGKRLTQDDFAMPPPTGAPLSAWLSPEGRPIALGRDVDGNHLVQRGFNLPGATSVA